MATANNYYINKYRSSVPSTENVLQKAIKSMRTKEDMGESKGLGHIAGPIGMSQQLGGRAMHPAGMLPASMEELSDLPAVASEAMPLSGGFTRVGSAMVGNPFIEEASPETQYGKTMASDAVTGLTSAGVLAAPMETANLLQGAISKTPGIVKHPIKSAKAGMKNLQELFYPSKANRILDKIRESKTQGQLGRAQQTEGIGIEKEGQMLGRESTIEGLRAEKEAVSRSRVSQKATTQATSKENLKNLEGEIDNFVYDTTRTTEVPEDMGEFQKTLGKYKKAQQEQFGAEFSELPDNTITRKDFNDAVDSVVEKLGKQSLEMGESSSSQVNRLKVDMGDTKGMFPGASDDAIRLNPDLAKQTSTGKDPGEYLDKKFIQDKFKQIRAMRDPHAREQMYEALVEKIPDSLIDMKTAYRQAFQKVKDVKKIGNESFLRKVADPGSRMSQSEISMLTKKESETLGTDYMKRAVDYRNKTKNLASKKDLKTADIDKHADDLINDISRKIAGESKEMKKMRVGYLNQIKKIRSAGAKRMADLDKRARGIKGIIRATKDRQAALMSTAKLLMYVSLGWGALRVTGELGNIAQAVF